GGVSHVARGADVGLGDPRQAALPVRVRRAVPGLYRGGGAAAACGAALRRTGGPPGDPTGSAAPGAARPPGARVGGPAGVVGPRLSRPAVRAADQLAPAGPDAARARVVDPGGRLGAVRLLRFVAVWLRLADHLAGAVLDLDPRLAAGIVLVALPGP